MNYSSIPEMKNTTYYMIIVFKDKNKNGTTLKNEYKRLENAIKKLNELASSGMYEYIYIRKEEVLIRTRFKEISISKPLKEWSK